MVIRRLMATDSREEISNIYVNKAGNMLIKVLLRRVIWTVYPRVIGALPLTSLTGTRL